VFTFSDADHNGGETPENWGRAHELSAVNNMFDPNYSGTLTVSSIVLTLQYTDDNWTSFSPPDTLMYAGEQWYAKPVTYSFEIQTKQSITITGRDLKSHLALTATFGRGMTNGAVQDISWGRAKMLYEEDPGYQDLSARDDALINLELAYSGRDVAEYASLLDDDLIFYLSEADIANGIPYTQFDKQDEIVTLTNMNDDTRQDRVLSVDIDLFYPAGHWSVFVPEDNRYDGETWYQKTVVYNMAVQVMPDMTYMNYGIDAKFTVREVEGQSGAKIWQIVRWQDDVMGGFLRADLEKSAFVEETTWGRVKSLYR
jgi:hypothetical protein